MIHGVASPRGAPQILGSTAAAAVDDSAADVAPELEPGLGPALDLLVNAAGAVDDFAADESGAGTPLCKTDLEGEDTEPSSKDSVKYDDYQCQADEIVQDDEIVIEATQTHLAQVDAPRPLREAGSTKQVPAEVIENYHQRLICGDVGFHELRLADEKQQQLRNEPLIPPPPPQELIPPAPPPPPSPPTHASSSAGYEPTLMPSIPPTPPAPPTAAPKKEPQTSSHYDFPGQLPGDWGDHCKTQLVLLINQRGLPRTADTQSGAKLVLVVGGAAVVGLAAVIGRVGETLSMLIWVMSCMNVTLRVLLMENENMGGQRSPLQHVCTVHSTGPRKHWQSVERQYETTEPPWA